jgi:hypothetical protein
VRLSDDKSIRRWYEQFRETVGVEKSNSTGWPKRSDVDEDHVGQVLAQISKQSVS